MNDALNDLFDFLRFPTISAQSAHIGDMRSCADWLATKFTQLGFAGEVQKTPGHPLVVARSPRRADYKTILVYGHYDVQAPDPLDEWLSPPFEPTLRDGKIFARGAADNKGQIMALLHGAASLLPDLPVNLIFFIEGEEECGSSHLPEFLEKHKSDFACDAILVSDTGMVAADIPTLTYSLRGMAALELRVKGPARDLHSGTFGGGVMNPAIALARLIASIHDADGHILIEGFYDAVLEPLPWERALEKQNPTNEADFLRVTGAPAIFGEKGFSLIERTGSRPTAEVNGFGSGYQGEGSKTIIPSEAFAKISFRLAPRQDSKKILELATAHFQKHLPLGVTLDVRPDHSADPYFMDPRSPLGEAVARGLERAWGRPAVLVREGASIPVIASLTQILGCDALLAGLIAPDACIHSPNEHLALDTFEKGIAMIRTILEEL